MVFRGKPSSFCSLCRERKIKCDEARPECSQCTRVKVPCSGYRNLQDLIFRDETKSVYRRAVFPSRSRASPVRYVIPRGLQQPEDDLAVAYFYTRFVTSDDNFSPIQTDFVPHMARIREDTLTRASMICVGMASLANVRNSPSMALLARQKYVQTLSLTRAALSRNSSVDPKTVLASVLFLAMFETISTSTSGDPLSVWYRHLDGALYFLHSLDSDQRHSTAGVYTTFYLRRQLLLSYIYRQKYIPISLCSLSQRIGVIMPPEELMYHTLGDILAKLINLRMSMENKPTTTDAKRVIHSLLDINNELDKWLSRLPLANRDYSIVSCVSDEHFYGPCYYVYPNYRDATVWSEYFTIRALASDLLVNSLDYALLTLSQEKSTAYRQHRSKALYILQIECNNVCASAPYFLGRVGHLPMSSRSLGAYYFQWSLFICACITWISDCQRSWATAQLKSIGHEMGINLALVLGDLSERKT